jgi:hypothetical protein
MVIFLIKKQIMKIKEKFLFKYNNYNLIIENDTRKNVENIELKLNNNYSTSSFQSDLFEELSLQVYKQQKFTKMSWIPYENIKDIMYINKDYYINYTARLKSNPTRIKGIKVYLKELFNSEKMTHDEIKLVNIYFFFFNFFVSF